MTAWKGAGENRGMVRLAVNLAMIVCFLAAVTMAQGEVTFSLSFPDVASDTNQNWDDPTHGSLARATLQSVLDEVGREFAETATIELEHHLVDDDRLRGGSEHRQPHPATGRVS